MMRSTAYRIVTRPPRDDHDYSLFVFDGEGRLHEPLTVFASAAAERVTRATAHAYVRAIVPFFAALDARAALRWDGPIEQVRLAIEAYLISRRLKCQVRLPKRPKPNTRDMRGKVAAYRRAKLDRKVPLAGEFWLPDRC